MNQNISKHLPTIFSAAAGVGVGVTGYFSTKLGMQIEAEKMNLKSEDPNIRKGAKFRIAFKAIPAGISGLVTVGFIAGANIENKKQLAEASAVAATFSGLLKKYRSFETPERDKEIMQEIMTEGVEEEIKNDKSEFDPEIERWTDPYIRELSDGKVLWYRATEADILAAACYTINTYHNTGEVSLGVFYDCLRSRGVEIEKYVGENGIVWTGSPERWDYYGRDGWDIDYATRTYEDGQEINTIFLDDDDDMIFEDDRKLDMWAQSLVSRN